MQVLILEFFVGRVFVDGALFYEIIFTVRQRLPRSFALGVRLSWIARPILAGCDDLSAAKVHDRQFVTGAFED